MTLIKRLRGATLIATVVALGAMLLPASAMAGRSHVLKLYKVEQHIDVEGDATYTLKCNDTDIATDGMWRIDDVSQDNEFDLLDQYNQTIPTENWPSDSDADGRPDTYTFRFLPLAGGDVQGKVWVTCLENPISSNGHTHSWVVNNHSYAESSVQTTGVQSYQHTDAACPSGAWIPIAPGFRTFPTTNEGYGYIQRSLPYTSGGNVGWEWKFNVTSADVPPSDFLVTTYFSCLRLKTTNGGSPAHAHRLVQQYRSANVSIPGRQIAERSVSCGEHYKGMVGGFDFSDPSLYFLGMDPRIKSRAFKFVNTDNVAHSASLRLSCFKDKTT